MKHSSNLPGNHDKHCNKDIGTFFYEVGMVNLSVLHYSRIHDRHSESFNDFWCNEILF